MRGPVLTAFVAALALATALVAILSAIARQPYRRPARPAREPRPELYLTATEDYRAGRWDEARQGFETLLASVPHHLRAQDFLDRLDAIALESERLARAEEALVGGRHQEALVLATSVPPNSPLFAQAEALARVVKAQADPTALQGAGARPGEAPTVELRSVLQQALALYNAGRFEEAAARARELAAEADGEVRTELEQWARRCARFGSLYEGLPERGALGGTLLARATQALVWDRELGGAHARTLRPRVVAAYRSLVEAAWERNDPQDACARWVEGRHWEPRDSQWGPWPQRCSAEARTLLASARQLETGDRQEALSRYRQVVRMVPASTETYAAARRALAKLASPPGPR